MRDALRRVFVILVAFAFLSGTVETALSLACHTGGGMHTMASLAGPEHHPADKQRALSKNADGTCFACCILGFSVLAPNNIEIAVEISSVSFAPTLNTLSGRPVVLDPGIPKSTA
jgi:hypothetical protein